MNKQKKRKKRKVTEKHDLDDDSDKELDQLRSKYCTGSKKMGNNKMKAIENDVLQKKRIFIDEENSDSEDMEVKKGFLTCLECAEMKAMDDTLINSKEIQLQVSNGQCQLDELKSVEKHQKCHNALLEVKRDKEIKSSCAILNSNNNNMNNSNNTNSTSHDNSTTTTSSNVNNSNNSTNTTSNSGNSNCNNTHNINISIHDAGLREQRKH